jgi:hypothetical protein
MDVELVAEPVVSTLRGRELQRAAAPDDPNGVVIP